VAGLNKQNNTETDIVYANNSHGQNYGRKLFGGITTLSETTKGYSNDLFEISRIIMRRCLLTQNAGIVRKFHRKTAFRGDMGLVFHCLLIII
jgi:hypothetical protein